MPQWTLALSSALGLATLALAYYIVLFNGAGGFDRVARAASFWDSPFWAGVPHRGYTAALQGTSVTLYLAWVVLMTISPPPAPSTLEFLNVAFLAASMAWPFAAYQGLATGRRAWMWAASLALWVVAACVVALLVLSPAPHRYLLLPLAVLTTLVDGVLWTRAALSREP